MSRRSLRLSLSLGLAALCSLGLPTAVQAAGGDPPSGPIDRLDPAPAGDAFVALPSAEVSGMLRPSVSLLLSFARAPLAVRAPSGSDSASDVNVVDYQILLHALVSLEILQRVKVDVDIPTTLAQNGDSTSIGGTMLSSHSGASLNDLRVGARVQVLRQTGLIPAAAIALSAWIPSGNEYAFTGSSKARFEPQVIVGANYGPVLWSLSVGRRLQPFVEGSLLGSQTVAGAAVALKLGGFQIGPEVIFGWDSRDSNTAVTDGMTPSLVSSIFGAEALLSARYELGPLSFGLGGGPGFGRATGTPSYRLFASVGFSMDFLKPVEVARTVEPLIRPEEPRLPSALLGDRDGDTVSDGEDACPTVVGDATPGAFRRGCPPDRDKDQVFDADDHCPDEPGVASSDPAKNGCPLDSDGDTIPDTKDACPNESGKPTDDPKTNGCPPLVRLEGAQIVILQQVHFATGDAAIKPDSFDLLSQVASVMKQHPEIIRISVDGHTDNVGGGGPNLNLSQRRALSVVRWLTENGVDARRLEARGFGMRRPLALNTNEAGRAKNRRVEFLIRRRAPEREAAWRDGPLE